MANGLPELNTNYNYAAEMMQRNALIDRQRKLDAQSQYTNILENEKLQGEITENNALAKYREKIRKMEIASKIPETLARSGAYISNLPKEYQAKAYEDFANVVNEDGKESGLYLNPKAFRNPDTGEFMTDDFMKWNQNTLDAVNKFTGDKKDDYVTKLYYNKKNPKDAQWFPINARTGEGRPDSKEWTAVGEKTATPTSPELAEHYRNQDEIARERNRILREKSEENKTEKKDKEPTIWAYNASTGAYGNYTADQMKRSDWLIPTGEVKGYGENPIAIADLKTGKRMVVSKKAADKLINEGTHVRVVEDKNTKEPYMRPKGTNSASTEKPKVNPADFDRRK